MYKYRLIIICSTIVVLCGCSVDVSKDKKHIQRSQPLEAATKLTRKDVFPHEGGNYRDVLDSIASNGKTNPEDRKLLVMQYVVQECFPNKQINKKEIKKFTKSLDSKWMAKRADKLYRKYFNLSLLEFRFVYESIISANPYDDVCTIDIEPAIEESFIDVFER